MYESRRRRRRDGGCVFRVHSAVDARRECVDAALAAEPARVRRILAVLRQEGVQPLAVHGAFLSQVRQLIDGSNRRLPPQRQRLLNRASERLSRGDLEGLLRDAGVVDQRVKGLRVGDPWRALETLTLRLAGASVPGPWEERL